MKNITIMLFILAITTVAKAQTDDADKLKKEIKELEQVLKSKRLKKQMLSKNSNILTEDNSLNGKYDNNYTSGTTNTYVIEYDFRTKTYSRNMVAPKINKPVVYKIKNINRLAYNIVIKSKDSMLTQGFKDEGIGKGNTKSNDTINPSITGDKNDPATNAANSAQFSVKLDDEKDLKKKEKQTSRLDAEEKEITAKIRKNDQAMDAISAAIKKLEDKKNEVPKNAPTKSQDTTDTPDNPDKQSDTNVPQTSSNSEDRPTDPIVRSKNETADDAKQVDSLAILKKSLTNLDMKQDELKRQRQGIRKARENGINNIIDVKFKGLKFKFSEVYKIYLQLNKLKHIKNSILDLSCNPQIKDSVEFTIRYNRILKKYGGNEEFNLDAVMFDFMNLETLLNDFDNQYSDLVNDADLDNLSPDAKKNLMKLADALQRQVDSIKETFNKEQPAIIVDSIDRIRGFMTYRSTYTYTSSPIQPFKDLVEFDIDIRTNDKKTFEYNDNRHFKHTEYTRGGVRYDFSAGISFSFGLNEYDFTSRSLGNGFAVIEKHTNNDYLPSIAGMLHVSLRTQRLVSFGFTLGASIGTSDFDINSLFPGISVMVGKTEKIIFTVGPALKKINYLDSNFELGKPYEETALPNELGTAETFKVGMFIGVSWNLTNKQRSSFKLPN